MITARKSLELLSLLPARPQEFLDRVATLVEVRADGWLAPRGAYDPANWNDPPPDVRSWLTPLLDVMNEPGLAEIEAEVLARLRERGEGNAFNTSHNADLALARCCYAACRVLRPNTVIETGVAHGVTSAFLLQALEWNEMGTLISIDLPPLGSHGDQLVGMAIPPRLRSRWRLHRSPSKRVLRGLLDEVGVIDLFVHDSLHTYRNMKWEFETIWPYLREGGMVIADDVQDNAAFLELRWWTGRRTWSFRYSITWASSSATSIARSRSSRRSVSRRAIARR